MARHRDVVHAVKTLEEVMRSDGQTRLECCGRQAPVPLLLFKFDVFLVKLLFSVSLACQFSPSAPTPGPCGEEMGIMESCSGVALVPVL